MSLTDSLAQSIATMEGFFNSTSNPSNRNNNPGNLVPPGGSSSVWAGQTGVDQYGFATFATAQDGWNALYQQISLDASRGLDLSQFISKYAPASENNTSNYLSYLEGQLGVSGSTLLSSFGAGDPANPPTAPAHHHSATGPTTYQASSSAHRGKPPA